MNQTVETFMRIDIDCDQRNWVKLLFSPKYLLKKKTRLRRKSIFFSHGYHYKILETVEKLHAGNCNFIQKTIGIINKLKKANDWVQTVMAIAQQEQQK